MSRKFNNKDEPAEREFFILLFIGLAFLLIFFIGTAVNLLASDGEFWSTGWAIIPGFILVAIAIVKGIEVRQTRDLIISTIDAYNGTVSVDQLAKEVGLTPVSFKRELIKLRPKIAKSYHFEANNLVIGDKQTQDVVESTKKAYAVCPSCGTAYKDTNTLFCEHCGTKMN